MLFSSLSSITLVSSCWRYEFICINFHDYDQFERISHLTEQVTHEGSALAEFLGEGVNFLKEPLGPFLEIVVFLLEFFLEELILGKYLLFLIVLEGLDFGLETIVVVLEPVDDLGVPPDRLLFVDDLRFQILQSLHLERELFVLPTDFIVLLFFLQGVRLELHISGFQF